MDEWKHFASKHFKLSSIINSWKDNRNGSPTKPMNRYRIIERRSLMKVLEAFKSHHKFMINSWLTQSNNVFRLKLIILWKRYRVSLQFSCLPSIPPFSPPPYTLSFDLFCCIYIIYYLIELQAALVELLLIYVKLL